MTTAAICDKLVLYLSATEYCREIGSKECAALFAQENENMRAYNMKDFPNYVFGVPNFEKTREFRRLPRELFPEGSGLHTYGQRTPGARVCFKTDADRFTVRGRLAKMTFDKGMSIFACQSVAVMLGERENSTFIGLTGPDNYETLTFEREFTKPTDTQEVTLWLPRNEQVADIEILLPDGASFNPPTPYKYGKALYYGSSITEGGCC